MASVGWLFFSLFVAAVAVSGIYHARQVKHQQHYLLANRKTSLLALIATLVMTEFNTTTLIAFSSLGYQIGPWAVILASIFLTGLIFYALTVAKRWKRFNGISVAHYFSERYNRTIGTLVAMILFAAMAGFSATYIKSLTFIFQPLFPHLSPWVISAVLVACILFMTIRGGLVAIIRTDVISFIALLIFFPVLFYYAWQLPSTSATALHFSLATMQQQLPISFVISLQILTMFSYILAPWYGQKMVAARSEKIAFAAVLIAAVLIFLCYGSAIMATALLKQKGIVIPNAQMAIPFILHQALPTAWMGFAYAMLLMIAATTASGVWSAMVTLIIGNSQSNHAIGKSMLLMLVCAALSYGLSNTINAAILDQMILANIPIVALSFALLGGFYWQKTSTVGVYCSLSAGLISGIGAAALFGNHGMYTWYWAIDGVPFIFIAGIIGSLLWPDQASKADYSLQISK